MGHAAVKIATVPVSDDIVNYGALTADALRGPGVWPALMALLLFFGLAEIGIRLSDRLCRRAELMRRVAGYPLACALLGALLHAWAWMGGLTPGRLRLLAAMLVLMGLAGAVRGARALPNGWKLLNAHWRSASLMARAAGLFIATAAAALLVAALGPAVDYDSNVYHLAIPLDWLSRGVIPLRTEWCLARLAGLGEALNLLGLAAGSDCFGAMLQWAAAAGSAILLAARAHDAGGRLLGLLWIFACPAFVVLVPNQKPYALPLLAVLAAAALLLEARPDRADFAMAGALAGFALACKISFLPEAGLLALLAVYRSREWSGMAARGAALAGSAAAALLIAAPLLLRRALQFGDPFSPLLERFLAAPDPGIIGCVAMVTDFHARTPLQLLLLPLRAVILLPGGDPTYVIGLAFLGMAPLFFLWRRRPTLALMCAASLATAAAFGPFSPRFFLPAFLWCGLAAVQMPASRMRAWWLRGLLLQCAAVAALAACTASRRAPGIFSAASRASVEAEFTRGLDEARWLETAVPVGYTLLSPHTSYYRLTMPFRPSSRILYGLTPSVRRTAFAQAVRDTPSVWIAQQPGPPADIFGEAAAACGKPLAKHETPLVRIFRPNNLPVTLTLYTLDENRPGCKSWLDGAGTQTP